MAEVDQERMFYVGLKALAASAFPKHCRNCGRIYHTADQFISESRALRAGVTGLKQSFDDNDMTIVEVYRNCLCGSTLMDIFTDRRDSSEQGHQRRELFNTARSYLMGRGMSPEEARLCLLRLLRGEASAADLAALPHHPLL